MSFMDFLIKKSLKRLIIDTSYKYIDSFKENVSEIISTAEDKDTFEKHYLYAREDYLDAVANDVLDNVRKSSASASARIQLCIIGPSICGYDIDWENSIMAGSLYAFCFYAVTNKVAKSKDCIELNHIQHSIIDKALLDLEITKEKWL